MWILPSKHIPNHIMICTNQNFSWLGHNLGMATQIFCTHQSKYLKERLVSNVMKEHSLWDTTPVWKPHFCELCSSCFSVSDWTQQRTTTLLKGILYKDTSWPEKWELMGIFPFACSVWLFCQYLCSRNTFSLRAQPFSFTLYQRRAEKDWLVIDIFATHAGLRSQTDCQT